MSEVRARPKITVSRASKPNGKQKSLVARPARFRANESVVYPSHGVGRVVRIEDQMFGEVKVPLLVIYFEKEKMTLRVPKARAADAGLRSLSSPTRIREAIETLKGRARIKRMMWSRRAQEYEQKINSGDILSIAEVVRDLHRVGDQSQSYSERQLYQQARERLVSEVAAVQKTDVDLARERVDEALLTRAA